MNDKLTQRPEFWIENDKRNEGIGYEAIDHIRALQAYIETLERGVQQAQDVAAELLAEAKQAPVDKEGWLTRETVTEIDNFASTWSKTTEMPVMAFTVRKLCRMALAALNGPPAVDLGALKRLLYLVNEDRERLCGDGFTGDSLSADVQKALGDAPLFVPAVDWMPIETAPKDGTVVLVAHATHGWVHEVLWRRHYEAEHSCTDECCAYEWRSRYDDAVSYIPTHWLPLPPAPTDHKGGKL